MLNDSVEILIDCPTTCSWIRKGSVNIPASRFAILNLHSFCRLGGRFGFASVALLLASALLVAQTVGTGSIVGVVTDPQGKVIVDAKVGITNKATAAVIHVTTSAAGWYSSGPIQPGEYLVRVESKGFTATPVDLVVQTGATSSGSVKMQA